jgi:ABC-type glucose/galactose transport system permease subunit
MTIKANGNFNHIIFLKKVLTYILVQHHFFMSARNGNKILGGVSSETSFAISQNKLAVTQNFDLNRNKQFRLFRCFLYETKQPILHVSQLVP